MENNFNLRQATSNLLKEGYQNPKFKKPSLNESSQSSEKSLLRKFGDWLNYEYNGPEVSDELIDEFLETLDFLGGEYSGPDLSENIKKPSLNEETNGGLITFDQLKQTVNQEYQASIEDINDGGEYYDDIVSDEILQSTNIDELINILDGLGFNGDEAYDFIFISILK